MISWETMRSEKLTRITPATPGGRDGRAGGRIGGRAEGDGAGRSPADTTEARAAAGPTEVERAEAGPADRDVPWRRLDPRVIAAVGGWCLLAVLAAAAVMWWRGAPWWLHVSVPVPVLGVVGHEALRWRKTFYRLTPERIELR